MASISTIDKHYDAGNEDESRVSMSCQFGSISSCLGNMVFETSLSEKSEKMTMTNLTKKICKPVNNAIYCDTSENTNTPCEGKYYKNSPMHYIEKDGTSVFAGY